MSAFTDDIADETDGSERDYGSESEGQNDQAEEDVSEHTDDLFSDTEMKKLKRAANPVKAPKPHKRHADTLDVPPTKSKKRKVVEDLSDDSDSELISRSNSFIVGDDEEVSDDLNNITHAQLDNEEAEASDHELMRSNAAKPSRITKLVKESRANGKMLKPTIEQKRKRRAIAEESSESETIEDKLRKECDEIEMNEQKEFDAAPYDGGVQPLKLANKETSSKLLQLPNPKSVTEIKPVVNGKSHGKQAKPEYTMALETECVMGSKTYVVTHCGTHCPLRAVTNNIDKAQLQPEHCYTVRCKEDSQYALVLWNPKLGQPRLISPTSFKSIANSKKNAVVFKQAMECNNFIAHSETDHQILVEPKVFEEHRKKMEERKLTAKAKAKPTVAATAESVDLTESPEAQKPVAEPKAKKPLRGLIYSSGAFNPQTKLTESLFAVKDSKKEAVDEFINKIDRSDGDDLFYRRLDNFISVTGFEAIREWAESQMSVLDERLKLKDCDPMSAYYADTSNTALNMDMLKPLLLFTPRGRRLMCDLAKKWGSK